MKFTEAKNAAEVEGTEKSKNFRKVARSAIIALVIIITLIISTMMVANWKKSPERQQKQSPSSQPTRSTERVLVMPANGDSARLTPPTGYKLAVTGNGLMTHCVYSDGRPEMVVDMAHQCADGFTAVYLHDVSGEENRATYKYIH